MMKMIMTTQEIRHLLHCKGVSCAPESSRQGFQRIRHASSTLNTSLMETTPMIPLWFHSQLPSHMSLLQTLETSLSPFTSIKHQLNKPMSARSLHTITSSPL